MKEDFELLNTNIEPESGVELFSEYAIKCVSQGNTVGSRTWRKDFLKEILGGTYVNSLPKKETVDKYHKILCDLCTIGDEICPPYLQECPICENQVEGYNKDDVKLGWPNDIINFQLSNSKFSHLECAKDSEFFHVPDDPNQLKFPNFEVVKKKED